MKAKYSTGFSFIIPAFNEEASIRRCVNAIEAEMERCKYKRYQIIVVDNNSTDRTADLAEKAGARVIREERKGVVWARQAGAEYALFSMLVFIDADNIMPPGWFDAAVDYVSLPAVAAVSGPVRYFDRGVGTNIATSMYYKVAKLSHRFLAPMVQGGNYMIRHDVFDKMGGYDTSIAFYGEDTRTAQLAAEHGDVLLDDGMWIWSSGRRFDGQGMFKTGWLYTINYLSVALKKKPVTKDYEDFRS